MAEKESANLGAELLKASRKGDLKQVKELLAQGADIHYDPPAGTPLENAVSAGHANVASELIQAGADVHRRTIYGSLVQYAIHSEQPKMIPVLVRAGASVAGDGTGSPLLDAVTNNKIQIAQMLINAGADVNEMGSVACGDSGEPEVTEEKMGNIGTRITHVPNPPSANKATPLIVAVRRGYLPMIKLLLDARADPEIVDGDGFAALAWATKYGNKNAIDILTKRGAKRLRFPEGSPTAAILEAAKKGDCARLKELIEQGVDVNSRFKMDEGDVTPLNFAAENGRAEVVQLLIDSGAFVNGVAKLDGRTPVRTPLICAAEKGHVGVVELLLRLKANVHVKNPGDGRVALHFAAQGGYAEIVRMLLKQGTKPDVKAANDELPLVLAAGKGHEQAVRVLLEAGANPDQLQDKSYSPLLSAAWNGHTNVVKLLLKAGASPQNKALDAVQYAASHGHVEIVKLLLDAGAKLKRGVLSDAAMTGGPKITEALLKAGANPNESDKIGSTPLIRAVHVGNTETIALLLAAGAEINAFNGNDKTALDLAKSDPTIELLIANGGKRAKDLPKPAKKKVKNSNEQGEEPEVPDFSERAKSLAYRAAVADLERVFGIKARPISEEGEPHLEGCVSFAPPSEKVSDVMKQQQMPMMNRGFYFVRCGGVSLSGQERFALLPTTDWREVLLAWQTNGANFDLMPQDIVDWLARLEKDQPFVLTGVSFDQCEGNFTTPIKNPKKLAKKICEFCPDIVDQGCGDVNVLAEEIVQRQAFYFWWD